MMHRNLQRAQLLMGQSRHKEAATELRQALGDNPNDALLHALLAICLVENDDYSEATAAAHQAIHLAPDDPFSHYAHAVVLTERNRFKEALPAIEQAIRLDPGDAQYLGLLAAIRLNLRDWQGALSAAEQGLAIDPEEPRCTNLRAMALVKLGRKELAQSTIDSALANDPENALTHANQGWTLLERGQPKQAMEHFREALRLDPDLEWARLGIVEALKAKHWLYRIMLAYFLWMAKLSGGAQWAIVIGLFVGYRVLLRVADESPELAPFVMPLLVLYVGFVLLSWTARPMFNLLLRLNRFGRLALSREQIVASNWLLGCLAPGLLLLVGYAATGHLWLLIGGLVFCGMMVPVAGTFECSSGWPRIAMATYSAVLACLGLGSLVLLPIGVVLGGRFMQLAGGLTNLMLIGFVWGVFLFSIVANVVAGMVPKK